MDDAPRGLFIELSTDQTLGEFVLAADVCEALFAPQERESRLLIIEAEKRQHGGVEIVRVHFILGGAEAKFVGSPDHFAAPDAASRHPGAETVGVMISTLIALHARGSPKLPGVDNQRAFEHATLL